MPPKEIHVFLDGTFTLPFRTHSKISITNIPTSMAGMVSHILGTLLSRDAPLSPKILLSAGHHDISPQNLPTVNPEYLDHNDRTMIRGMTRHVLDPLVSLYHNVARRGGTLWVTSLCPRPTNFYINPVVSNVLSEAFLYANAFISNLNHKQNLTNMPINQILQYPSFHPALRTMQRTINMRMYRRDALRLTSLAQERIWRRMTHILRQTWGPKRSGSPPAKSLSAARRIPCPPPKSGRRHHRRLEKRRKDTRRRR